MKRKAQEKEHHDGNKQLVRAPLTFQHDLRYAASSLRGRARLCGVGKDMVRRILAGLPVSAVRLDMAMSAFYKRDMDNMVRRQMVGMVQGSTAASWTFLRLIRGLARIVQEHGESMKMSEQTRERYIFAPRDTIVRMVDAIAEGAKVLREVHKACPEYDSLVFRDAKSLLKRLKEEDEADETSGQNVQS